MGEKLQQTVEQGKFSSTIDSSDLPPALWAEVQKELQAVQAQPELSIFERKRLSQALPLQQVIQATTHVERLEILEASFEAEKSRLRTDTEQGSVPEVIDAVVED